MKSLSQGWFKHMIYLRNFWFKHMIYLPPKNLQTYFLKLVGTHDLPKEKLVLKHDQKKRWFKHMIHHLLFQVPSLSSSCPSSSALVFFVFLLFSCSFLFSSSYFLSFLFCFFHFEAKEGRERRKNGKEKRRERTEKRGT